MADHKLDISYKIYGEGFPILCIHGLNLDKRMFYQSVFQEQFNGKKVITIDLPGYGNSEILNDITIECICHEIITTLEKLNIKHFSICGYCMGGVFALYIAKLYPNKVKELYLYETMLIYPFWMNLCKTRLFEWGYNLANRKHFACLLSIIPSLREFSSEKRNQFCDRKWHRDINKIYLDLFKQIPKNETYSNLKQLETKCVIKIATNTYREVLKSAVVMQHFMKKTELSVIQGKGHLFFL